MLGHLLHGLVQDFLHQLYDYTYLRALGIRPCARNDFYPSPRFIQDGTQHRQNPHIAGCLSAPLLGGIGFLRIVTSTVFMIFMMSSPSFYIPPSPCLCKGFIKTDAIEIMVKAALKRISICMYRWTVPGKPKKAIVL